MAETMAKSRPHYSNDTCQLWTESLDSFVGRNFVMYSSEKHGARHMDIGTSEVGRKWKDLTGTYAESMPLCTRCQGGGVVGCKRLAIVGSRCWTGCHLIVSNHAEDSTRWFGSTIGRL